MKRAEIRKRVKRHIKSRGASSDFEITESFCLYWWKLLNESIFDGKLKPPVRFEIRNFRNNIAGYWKPYGKGDKNTRRSIIGINSSITGRKTFLDVLVHEMVHQWEWEVQCCDADVKYHHGKDFYAWRPIIERRADLHLAFSYDI